MLWKGKEQLKRQRTCLPDVEEQPLLHLSLLVESATPAKLHSKKQKIAPSAPLVLPKPSLHPETLRA